MNITSDPTANALVHLLDATALRQRVLSNNVANSDTPGYTRQDVSFQSELADAIKEGNLQSFQPSVQADATPSQRGDGNNVTLEREMTELNKNALLNQMAIQLLQSKIAITRSAITGRS